MTNKIAKKHYFNLIAVILGAIGGYAYYYFVGCESGSCPIQSNPYISVLYGGLMGYLLFSLFFDFFKKKEVESDSKKD